MISKYYGDLYSKTSAPKGVDFISCDLLELGGEGEGEKEYFCVEAFIDGSYVKYNNNAGASLAYLSLTLSHTHTLAYSLYACFFISLSLSHSPMWGGGCVGVCVCVVILPLSNKFVDFLSLFR